MLSVIEEYLGLEGGPPFSRKSDQNSNTPRFTGKDRTMGTNLQGYHLLWPDLPIFSQLQFTAPFTRKSRGLKAYLIIRKRFGTLVFAPT